MAEKEKSVTWVIAMIMILIAAFGWAFMAAGYAHSEKGWRNEGAAAPEKSSSIRRASRAAFADFVVNAFRQLPELPSVLSFNLKNRWWLPALIVGLEVLAVFGGIKMKSLERELSGPPRRRRV